MALTNTPGSRACTECHKAKRKCNKGMPACLRCCKQELACRYPNSTPSAFTPIASFVGPESGTVVSSAQEAPTEDGSNTFGAEIDPFINSNNTITPLDGLSGSWFLSPETFLIDHTPIPMPPNFKAADLDRFIQQLLDWLKTWVLTGSNLFIHHHLYDLKLPVCMQIAFTTVLSYFNKTPETTNLILRALNARAGELVADIEAVWTDTMDIIDMPARVQSLLVYQVVGLLDGDPRSRYLAEQRSTLVINLLGKVLDKASATLSHDVLASELQDITRTDPTPAHYIEREWRAWVVSECVRRTWLLGTGFNSAYDGLKTGWTSCGGDLMCTTRNGLWEAKTSYEWSKLCMIADVRFVGRFRAEWLFDVPPDEVDDFVKMLLDITYGKDRTSMWLRR